MSGRLFLMLGRSRMLRAFRVFAAAGRVLLMELLGAVRAFEFMAFAGNARQGHGHEKQGEKFHRAAT